MKHTHTRRYRRRNSAYDAASCKKENKREQQFFGEAVHESFFKPVVSAQQPAVQRKCEDCEKEDKVKRKAEMKEEEKVQKKEGPAANNKRGSTAATYISSINGKGENMNPSLQSFFEQRIGADLGEVKIHTGKAAAESAKDINAQAYAYRNHIVFNEGKYQPQSEEGKRLLAHELVHVAQQDDKRIQRMPEDEQVSKEAPMEEKVELPPVFTTGIGTLVENKIAFANCEGVSVQGHTSANYSSSYSASSSSVTKAENCSGCTGNDCVTIVGNVVSVFSANPTVSLPGVPGGLNECEHNAVQSFINGTLSQHEQQHVDAFNTYNGTVTTPFSYTGCRAGFDAYIQAMHNRIDVARVSASNALSDALDPFNPTIPCDCPDPEPEQAPETDGGTE